MKCWNKNWDLAAAPGIHKGWGEDTKKAAFKGPPYNQKRSIQSQVTNHIKNNHPGLPWLSSA